MTEKLQVVRGSGNVFADVGLANADVEQAKVLLASEIINILDQEALSVREAGRLTGVAYTDFSRIRNLDLGRFTIDRLMKILGRFDRRIDVQVAVTPKTFEPA